MDMAINCYYYHQCQKRTPITITVANRTSHQNESKNRLTEYQRRRSKEVRVIKFHEKFRSKIIIVSQHLEPENILKIFFNFTNIEPHYSYKIYSYKKRVYVVCA